MEIYPNLLKEYCRRILLILSSFLFTIILVEITLRVALPIPYSMELEYIPDGYIRFRLAPSKIYNLKSGGKCSINALGFRRTNEIKYFKTLTTFRIVVLGGSSVFSYEVDDKRTWVALLENNLRNYFNNKNIEVINAGVPGYSVFDSKLNYLYKIRRMKPDVVIIYHTWNDMKAFKALESGSTFINHPPYQPDYMKTFLRNFQIAWRIRFLYHKYILPQQRENLYADSINSTIKSISDGGPAHQWERKNYEDLALLLKSDEVLPVFVTQASLVSRDNILDPFMRSHISAEIQGLSFNQILEQWEAVSNIIATTAKKNNILFIDSYSKCPHNLDNFEDHVHLTEKGNEKIAEIIFDGLIISRQFNDLIKRKLLNHTTGMQ